MPKTARTQISIRGLDDELLERINAYRQAEGLTWPQIGDQAFRALLDTDQAVGDIAAELAKGGPVEWINQQEFADAYPDLGTGREGAVPGGNLPDPEYHRAVAELVGKAPAPPVMPDSPRIAPTIVAEYLQILYRHVPKLAREGHDYIKRQALEDVEILSRGELPTSTQPEKVARTGLLRKAVAT